jgi:hypothetical protein
MISIIADGFSGHRLENLSGEKREERREKNAFIMPIAHGPSRIVRLPIGHNLRAGILGNANARKLSGWRCAWAGGTMQARALYWRRRVRR